MRGLIGLLALASLTGACGVNEFEQYRADIHSFRVQTVVSDRVELDVSDPIVATDANGWEDPAVAANAATESYIITNLRERLDRHVDPRAIAIEFEEVFVPEVAHGTSWRTSQGASDYDAQVIAEVSGVALSIDAAGLAEVTFRLHTRAYFTPTDKLIYETWGSHQVPVREGFVPFAAAGSNDPAALAAERVTNLLILNDLSGAHLRDIILDATADAALRTGRQMVSDVYR